MTSKDIMSQIKQVAGDVKVMGNFIAVASHQFTMSFDHTSADRLLELWRSAIRPALEAANLQGVQQVLHSATRKPMWRVERTNIFRMSVRFTVDDMTHTYKVS